MGGVSKNVIGLVDCRVAMAATRTATLYTYEIVVASITKTSILVVPCRIAMNTETKKQKYSCNLIARYAEITFICGNIEMSATYELYGRSKNEQQQIF